MKQILTSLTLLILFVFSQSSFCQSTRTITGTITDGYDNYGLPGVSILLKGTTTGTITDIDGKFSLTIPSGENQVLQVRYIGFKEQNIPIKTASEYNIVMEEEVALLEEVVVTGYGTTQKSMALGYSVSVSSSEMTRTKDNDGKSKTWKRSGMSDNSIRLQVGDNDFIPLEAAQMAVQIDGFRVRVLLDCFFYNTKGDGLEGVFKLKLPTEATPYYFAFGETEYLDEDEEDKKLAKYLPFNEYSLDEFNLRYQDIEDANDRSWRRVKEARIVSKQKAARAYEQTVSAGIDPALMEWGGADMFSCKVYPLSNNTLHRVVIGYDLYMTEALDFREYIMALPKVERDLKVDVVVNNTPGLVARIPKECQLKEQKEDRAYYTLSNPKQKELVFKYDTVEPVMLIQAEGESNSESIDIPYFAANYKVELPETSQENLPTDAVFLLDVSISSNPDKFNVWLTLMDEILDKNRDVIKRFAVLTFNIDTKWYTNSFQKNNYYNKERLLEYANTLALEGATDLATGLKEASNPSWLKEGQNQPKHIFLMSDADCNWGETNMHKFKMLLNEGDRVHTYKTGLSGTNTGVLNYLSKATGGFAFTVTGEEEASLTAKSFRYLPWNIESIEVEGIEDFIISGQPTQLYNGQKLIFTGRQIPEGNIIIKVNDGINKKTLTYSAKHKIISSLVSRIYGQIATAQLDNYGFQAEEAAVNYSTYYRVPGAYTSFLMLESHQDYDDFGIDDNDAESFVEDNFVTDLVKKLEEMGAITIAGDSKADFKRWMQSLSKSDNDLDFDLSEEFENYVESVPLENFTVQLKPQTYRLHFSAQQTEMEQELLQDEDVRFDNINKLMRKRKSAFGNADALRLLSTAVERNAADIQTIRDVAMIAIDLGMADHAYYMMRRIIEWREQEGLAYITAAEALAASNNVDLALIYYYICLKTDWDSDYGSIHAVAGMKCVKYLNELSNSSKYILTDNAKKFIPYLKELADERLQSEGFTDAEQADVVVVVNWNIPNTDIDLHIIEPSGEECYYGHKNTEIGGQLSVDVTSGYGPEIYVLRKSVSGNYSVKLDYYSSSGTQSASKAKAYIDVYRNWGRSNETVNRQVVELKRFNEYYETDEEEELAKVVLMFNIKDGK